MDNSPLSHTLEELRETLHTRVDLQELRRTLKWQDFVSIFHQRLELIDQHPISHRQNSLPVVIVPGFSGSADMVRSHADEMSKKGRRTLSINAPHGILIRQTSFPQVCKAAALIGALVTKKIKQVDAVGHSEGAITIVSAAKMRPDLFRFIVLMNPAGLIGQDSLFSLAMRFGADALYEGWREFRTQNAKRKLLLFPLKACNLLSNIYQSAREVHTISNMQVHEWIRDLQKQYGIQIALVQSPLDLVFPRSRMDTFIRSAGIPKEHLFYDTLVGTHDVVLTHPKQAMDAAETALQALERTIEGSSSHM